MTVKTTRALYWTATGLIFLMEGVLPALTGGTELAKEGIRHLGYPDYFRNLLTVFKVAGALALLLPFVGSRVKEWAYAGFALTFVSACVSHFVVDGPGAQAFFPLVVLAVLFVSYVAYHRLRTTAQIPANPVSRPHVVSSVPH